VPLTLIILAIGILIAVAFGVGLLTWGLQRPRQVRDGSGSSPPFEAATRRDAAIFGSAILTSVLAGVGCLVLMCVALVVGWFVFVWWAFKDFTLF
jgi:hypothetical protein